MSRLEELLALSKTKDRGDRAHEVCSSLRGLGFSNSELSAFTGGEFPTATINRWTRGVKVTSSDEKNELMAELRSFVEGGHKVSDIEACNEAESLLKEQGLDFERCIKLVGALKAVESTPIELQFLAVQLRENGLKVTDVKKGIDAQRELQRNGFNVKVQQEILRAANKYSTPDKVLETINEANAAIEIVEQRKQHEDEVEALLSTKMTLLANIQQINMDTKHLEGDIAVAKQLRERFYFDQKSMGELLETAEKHGSATDVIGALNAYTDLQEIKGKIGEGEASLKAMKLERNGAMAERDQLHANINKLHEQLGAVEQLTKTSKYVIMIAELIVKPIEARADDHDVAQLCVALLRAIQTRAAHSNMDPKLKSVIVKGDVNVAVNALEYYMRTPT